MWWEKAFHLVLLINQLGRFQAEDTFRSSPVHYLLRRPFQLFLHQTLEGYHHRSMCHHLLQIMCSVGNLSGVANLIVRTEGRLEIGTIGRASNTSSVIDLSFKNAQAFHLEGIDASATGNTNGAFIRFVNKGNGESL